MDSGDKTNKNADGRKAIWINLPRIGQVPKQLDDDGVVHIIGEDPEFGETPYCVYLGLRVGDRGPIRYGTVESSRAGDYFYADVPDSGPFDIHLKAQEYHNQKVTIAWWAIPLSSTNTIGVTLGPTPYLFPELQYQVVPPGAEDLGGPVEDMPDVGPEHARRLISGGIKTVGALARAGAKDVARILNISEVRAMSFIDRARRLLHEKLGK